MFNVNCSAMIIYGVNTENNASLDIDVRSRLAASLLSFKYVFVAIPSWKGFGGRKPIIIQPFNRYECFTTEKLNVVDGKLLMTLRNNNITDVYLVGLHSDLSILSSAPAYIDAGLNVNLVTDCTQSLADICVPVLTGMYSSLGAKVITSSELV